MSTYKLINGDCIEEMKKMLDNSIYSIVTGSIDKIEHKDKEPIIHDDFYTIATEANNFS